MRISDWSSDVCSSDLALIEAEGELVTYGQVSEDSGYDRSAGRHKAHFDLLSGSFDFNRNDRVSVEREDRHGNWRPIGHLDPQRRSEEHTSELQSLMRNSYAVFCLNKKTTTQHNAQTMST